MPRVTTGNTMAPCVVIGEKAAEFVKESTPCNGNDQMAGDSLSLNVRRLQTASHLERRPEARHGVCRVSN
jgi:hypothetical protein